MTLTTDASTNATYNASSIVGCHLWYVPPMQRTMPPAGAVEAPVPPNHARSKSTRTPLSVVHAKALYRPVPPLDCDDDGYPYCDSSAVESTDHWDSRAHLVYVVRSRFGHRDDVFAAADLGFYFERGNRRAVVVPDAMVVFGVAKHSRLSYKLWEESKVPKLVLEVVSRYTWKKDVYDKPPLYAALGVREYWLFDPLDVRRDGGPRLEGWRLNVDGTREPVPPCAAGDGFESSVLGLDFLLLDGEFRLRDPETGEVLRDPTESEAIAARADEEAARADEESAKREAAERRILELEAELREARVQGSNRVASSD